MAEDAPITLDELVTHFHRKSIGARPKISEQRGDYIAAFAADPDLVKQAREDLARLDALAQKIGETQLQNRDHEAHIRRRALARMLQRYDAA